MVPNLQKNLTIKKRNKQYERQMSVLVDQLSTSQEENVRLNEKFSWRLEKKFKEINNLVSEETAANSEVSKLNIELQKIEKRNKILQQALGNIEMGKAVQSAESTKESVITDFKYLWYAFFGSNSIFFDTQ